MAATVIVLSCCQGLPGSGEQWSAPLHATERDRKSEVGKGWYRCSIRPLSQRLWRAALQTSSVEYMTSYLLKVWEILSRLVLQKHMGIYQDGRDINFIEFIQFTETERAHEERLQKQLVSSCGLLSTGPQLLVGPYNPSLWSLWIKWSSSKDGSIQRSMTRTDLKRGHSRFMNPVCVCMVAWRGNHLCHIETNQNPYFTLAFHFQNMDSPVHNNSPLALPWIKPDSCIHYIIIHRQARFSMF